MKREGKVEKTKKSAITRKQDKESVSHKPEKRISKVFPQYNERKGEKIFENGVPSVLIIPNSPELKLDESTKVSSSITTDGNSKLPIQAIYRQQCQLYQSQRELSAADRNWFEKVITEGTANDKCSALALAIQDAPFYSLEHLEALTLHSQWRCRQ